MAFNFQIRAFCILPFILHKSEQITLYQFPTFCILSFIPQKNSANNPLVIIRIVHFTTDYVWQLR